MSAQFFDMSGLKCPAPTLKLTAIALRAKSGELVEVLADCPTFEQDVRDWCKRQDKVLVFLKDEGNGKKRCQIRC